MPTSTLNEVIPSKKTNISSRIRLLAPWVQSSSIYQIFLRAFTSEGTLRGAEKMLDHIADLGVTIVYLCPVVESDDDMERDGWSPRQKDSGVNNPKNPYRLKDYFTIDPEYGTSEDLASFIKRAHELGLKVILDLVYLHCGPGAVFIEEHPDFVKHNEDGSIVTNDWNFPILNFENAGLREYLWKNMEYFIEAFDLDGYRCDVSNKVPLDFWVEGRRRIEAIKPDVFMLAESAPPSVEEQEYAFDVSYGFRYTYLLNDVLEKGVAASELRELLENFREETMGARLLRAFDNHDISNDHKELRQEIVCPVEATNAALVLGFSLHGMPFIYNGQEVADANRHTLWSNRVHGDRHGIDWSNAVTPKGRARYELMKSLIALRKNEEALHSGATQWLENSDPESVLSFVRTCGHEMIFVYISMSTKSLSTKVDLAVDLSGASILAEYGASVQSIGDGLVVDSVPYGYILLKA